MISCPRPMLPTVNNYDDIQDIYKTLKKYCGLFLSSSQVFAHTYCQRVEDFFIPFISNKKWPAIIIV